MKQNKSPGSDGFSLEFYQAFWDALKSIFYNSLQEGCQIGELTGTQRQGILTLIFKTGDPENLGNWRPITLLNVDYKSESESELLLVTRSNDNHSPGPVMREVSP